jgi:hypothetical protein
MVEMMDGKKEVLDKCIKDKVKRERCSRVRVWFSKCLFVRVELGCEFCQEP